MSAYQKLTKEKEITIYARVGDFKGFREANEVENIQELIHRVEGKGRYRVRKILGSNGTRYVAGIKSEGYGGSIKTAIDEETSISASYFEANRIIADRLIVRDRFTFNGEAAKLEINNKLVVLPPIKYQADVFIRHDLVECEWVKIDIEVDDLFKAIEALKGDVPDVPSITISVTHLPFKPQYAFVDDGNLDSSKDKVKRMIWEEYAQSTYGGPLTPIEPSIAQPVPQNHDQPRTTDLSRDSEGDGRVR